MKKILLFLATMLMVQLSRSQKSDNQKYQGYDSVVVFRLSDRIETNTGVLCQNFNNFFSQVSEEDSNSASVFKLNQEETTKLVSLINSAYPYKDYERLIDVRAKVILYSKTGNIDTLCYGRDFERCFVYNGLIMQCVDENTYAGVKNMIWGHQN